MNEGAYFNRVISFQSLHCTCVYGRTLGVFEICVTIAMSCQGRAEVR